MSWYEKFKRLSYSKEISILKDYLKSGFDPYEYSHFLTDFLDHIDFEYDCEKDDSEIIEEVLPKLSKEELVLFEDYAKKKQMKYDPYGAPTTGHVDYEKVVKPGWMVHFTNSADSIAANGFEYGHSDMYSGMALTTWKKERQKEKGYNFAFRADSRWVRKTAITKDYGSEAVVFWGAGVEVYHQGDEQHQVIFWGPSIDNNMIFPVFYEVDGWIVRSWNSDRILKKVDSQEFSKIVDWIRNNYRMLQQIRNKKD